MRLAFYRGPGDWITRTIRLVTRGPYSHVEFVFGDGARFSASGRAPAGVRFSSEPHGPGWDFLLFRAGPQQERIARTFAAVLAGSAFQWRGLFRFLCPWLGEGPKSRWYCSELVLYLLQRCFGLFERVPLKISPNGLYRLCTACDRFVVLPPITKGTSISMNPNTVAEIAALVRALLPVGAEIASLFIHNPNSQHKLSVIVGDADTIKAVAQSVAQTPKA